MRARFLVCLWACLFLGVSHAADLSPSGFEPAPPAGALAPALVIRFDLTTRTDARSGDIIKEYRGPGPSQVQIASYRFRNKTKYVNVRTFSDFYFTSVLERGTNPMEFVDGQLDFSMIPHRKLLRGSQYATLYYYNGEQEVASEPRRLLRRSCSRKRDYQIDAAIPRSVWSTITNIRLVISSARFVVCSYRN